jgi:hypothetical protein
LIVGLTAGDRERQARALLLASLVYVDGVVLCDPNTADQVLSALQPNVSIEFHKGQVSAYPLQSA